MKVYAIIPARSGSKSLKDKNIRILNGKPMIAYSIEHALEAKTVDRVIVSTDSEEYAEIARSYGAETPFLRPKEISGDRSLDIETFEHALAWFHDTERTIPDICVHLRPTHPVRKISDIDAMVRILHEDKLADSVRSISPAKQTPYKMWTEDGKYIKPVANYVVPEAYNMPRQLLPQVYMQNACIDVVRSCVVTERGSMTGDRVRGYQMSTDYDIDTEEDFLRAERALFLKDTVKSGRKLRLCFDIDGVIAQKTPDNNYANASPITENISLINELAEKGHVIILHTARGVKTSVDWCDITKMQMEKWGVKYCELIFGKPHADAYVDDKNYELSELASIIE